SLVLWFSGSLVLDWSSSHLTEIPRTQNAEPPNPEPRTRSGFQRELILDRLPPPNNPPTSILNEHFRRQRPPIVIRRHCRSIGAGVADRQEITLGQRRQHP